MATRTNPLYRTGTGDIPQLLALKAPFMGAKIGKTSGHRTNYQTANLLLVELVDPLKWGQSLEYFMGI